MRNQKIWMLAGISVSLTTLFSYGEEANCELPLASPPTFGALERQGAKFLLPKYQREPSWTVFQLEAERTKLVLVGDKGKSNPMQMVTAGFRKEDFQAPGKYYPPQPAIGQSTPIRSISLSSPRLSPMEASELLASVAPLLGLKDSKLQMWIEKKMWDLTPQVSVEGTIPGGTVTLSIFATTMKDAGTVLEVGARLKWDRTPKAESGPRD